MQIISVQTQYFSNSMEEALFLYQYQCNRVRTINHQWQNRDIKSFLLLLLLQKLRSLTLTENRTLIRDVTYTLACATKTRDANFTLWVLSVVFPLLTPLCLLQLVA